MKEEKIVQLSVSNNNTDLIAKRSLSYKPKTRFDKLRMKDLIFPCSTNQKIVFISNTQGNSFRQQELSSFNIPSHLNVQSMINEVNQTCYNQWAKFRQEMEYNPFQYFHKMIKCCLIIALVLFTCLISETIDLNTKGLEITVYFTLVLSFFCFCIAVFAFSIKNIQQNPQLQMITVIRQKLAEFNKQQKLKYGEKPRFTWTCHFQCLWIAIAIN